MGNCNCKQGTNGTHHVCTECDILQLARNNYFTGKLLVERDFTDEQRYTMGKLRRHNQKLHGWGTVCGLKVKQHPNPACRSQYVVIEPGTAIDCCGREILVNCEEYFDFEAKYLAAWQAQNGSNSQPDANPHKLEICVSYKECPTEKVPALFDDCAAGTAACQPNRILESHCFDVIIDGPSTQTDPSGVLLKWDFTENIANAIKVAEDDASERLYVLTSASTTSATATLYVVDTANYTLLTPITLNNNLGLDVAVSPEGDFVYVALQPTTSGTTTPSGAPVVNVYSASNFTATVNQLTVGAAADPTVKLAIYPGGEGSLFTFGQTAGVTSWTGVNVAGPASTPLTAINSPVAMAVSPGNQYAYVATSGSTTIGVISLASPATVSATTITVATAPISLAIASTTANDKLAALDGAGNLYFFDIPSAGPGSGVTNFSASGFTYTKTQQVLFSPGGQWAYVLEQDPSGNAYVQPVDEHAVETTGANYMGIAIAVGVTPQSETISDDGTHIYVPYQGTSSISGGVAIVDVLQQDCSDIFQTVIDCCPDCAEGNCLILATINQYVYGDSITDPAASGPIGKDQIDNLTDRRLLVSTDVLTKAVQCILDQGASAGTQGATGATGPGLETGLVQISALSWTHGGQGALPEMALSYLLTGVQAATGGATVYTGNFTPPLAPSQLALLQITVAGCAEAANNGTFAMVSCSSTQLTLSNTAGVAETPPASATATAPLSKGFVIGFNGAGVQMPTATDAAHIFQVLFDPNSRQNHTAGYTNPCAAVGYIVSANVTTSANQITAATPTTGVLPKTPTQALAFVFDTTTATYRDQISGGKFGDVDIWIRLRGDFLLDTTGKKAISAEFVRADFNKTGTGERPAGTDLCLEGGTFESWFLQKH